MCVCASVCVDGINTHTFSYPLRNMGPTGLKVDIAQSSANGTGGKLWLTIFDWVGGLGVGVGGGKRRGEGWIGCRGKAKFSYKNRR